MLSDKFRRQLRQEATRWHTEELINQAQYQQIADRYSFDALDASSSSRFTIILIGLGSILLGLGAITFVASNWQSMSREFRVILLLTALICSNWLGFHLWQKTTRWQRLGQGFLILGGLVLGANIALMGQIFHINGELYGLFFLWGFGVLIMAYSLRSTPLGIMTVLLLGLGYLFHWMSYWNSLATDEDVLVSLITQQMLAIAIFVLVPLAYWCKSRSIGILAIIFTVFVYWYSLLRPETNFIAWTVRECMPIAATLIFIPLAYWCKSRSVFVFAALAAIAGLAHSIYSLNSFSVPGYAILALELTLPAALLWAYNDFPFQRQRSSSPAYAHLAHGLALIFLSSVCYFQSFYAAWSWTSKDIIFVSGNLVDWLGLLNVFLFAGVAIFAWWQILLDRHSERSLVTKIIGGFLLVEAIAIFWHGAVIPIPEIATFTYNVLLFLLAIGLIRLSLEKSQRLVFWSGIVLLSLQVLSRLFEYDTALVLKAFIFALSGVAVISAGLWFERHIQAIANTSNSSTNLSESSSLEDRS